MQILSKRNRMARIRNLKYFNFSVIRQNESNKGQNEKNMKELRSFVGSTKQYIKIVPNLASLGSPLPSLLNKKSIFQGIFDIQFF